MTVIRTKGTTFTWDEATADRMAKAAAASKRPYQYGPGPAPARTPVSGGSRKAVWTLADMAKLQAKLLAKGSIRYVAPNPFGPAA